MDERADQTVARVAKNAMAQIIALASTTVSKLLITIIIGRLFGAERVGEFAFVMTFSLIFTFLSTAGIPWAMIREVATHRDQAFRYAENGLTIVTFTGLCTIPLMIITASLMGRPATTCVAIGFVGLALVFDGLAQIVGAVFNGLERMEMAAIVMIVQELAFLIVGAVVLFLRLPFIWLFVVYVPSRLAGFLVSLPLYHKLLGRSLRPSWNRSFARDMLRMTAPYAANMALGPIYLRIDVVMLAFFQGNIAVGLYEAATSIFYRFNVFARTINNALMPLMAREFESQAERISTYINAAIKYQVVMGMPLSVVCVMLAGPLMNLLYGEGFELSATVFRLLATIITLRFIDNTLATALTASNLQSGRSIAVALAAVFNIVINLVVLPTYSFVGAAITTILTEVCFFSLLYLYLARRVSHPIDSRLLLKPAFAGSAMALALWLLRAWPLLPLLLLGSTVYLVTLVAVGTFSQQEVQVVLQIFRRGLDMFHSRRLAKRLSA
ncbi:MAG: flippase [Chloroflexota bacterium]|nr:flippase [Chloroflexota bacterium]